MLINNNQQCSVKVINQMCASQKRIMKHKNSKSGTPIQPKILHISEKENQKTKSYMKAGCRSQSG